jgi:hypothetical protein
MREPHRIELPVVRDALARLAVVVACEVDHAALMAVAIVDQAVLLKIAVPRAFCPEERGVDQD